MRIPADLPRRRKPRNSRRIRIIALIVIVVLILLLLSLRSLAKFWTDYLWFQAVGFTSVFRGVLLTKVFLGLVFIAIFFVILYVNLYLADRFSPATFEAGTGDELVQRYRDIAWPHRQPIRIITSVVFALFGGFGANAQWNNWDLFRYHVNFSGPGSTDPEYHKNIAFYVFELPFIKYVLNWFFLAFIVALLLTAVAHYLDGNIHIQGQGSRVSTATKTHISVLMGILALIKAVEYYYERLGLVLDRNYVVDGATATVVHATKPAIFMLMVIAIIAAALFLFNIRQKGWMLPAVGVGLWVLVWILIGEVYPAVYQQLRVKPSEQTREAPYIQRNINATLSSYGLTDVKSSQFTGNAEINANQVTGNSASQVANQTTLANVRLLDNNVDLVNTFDKYQALRNYYQFNDLSVDRYSLPASAVGGTGNQSQLVATIDSVRELNASAVPSGFVNSHLQYTHGYGAVLAPLSEAGINSDGTPSFTLADLPPEGTPSLNGTGSQVYYGVGSESNGYVIADSKTPELDYENSAGQQITTRYAGSGGVKAGGIFRRLAFALAFSDPNMVLSGQINDSSQVLYNRNIVSRAKKAAPFLKFDSDPYSVILNKQTYWVLDAYTTSNNYPYAQKADTSQLAGNSGLNTTFNYVRNSVKVVINAYNGSMKFFVMNNNDPIIETYEKAFPDLFTPVSQADKLIPGITNHWRYPEDLFEVQTNMYGRYHLTNASAFYSQAQAWTVSPDPGSGQLSGSTIGQVLSSGGAAGSSLVPTVARLAPQYALAHLPNSTQQSFLILNAYVPHSFAEGQPNLTAFLTASSDPNDYGTLRLYTTPPGNTVDGPEMITAAIKSNFSISQRLTLLNQQGSRVELGQVDMVPIDQTLLYVVPLYVESTSSNAFPTLRDVIVVYNNTAYEAGNASLDAALCQIANRDGSKPFASYCNTQAAQTPIPGNSSTGSGTSGSGSGSTASTTTTTTVPGGGSTATTVPAPSGGQSVQSLVAAANNALQQANQALANKNLGLYQSLVNQAEQDLSQAEQLSGGSGSSTATGTTTTLPSGGGAGGGGRPTTTTTKPASPTTTAKP